MKTAAFRGVGRTFEIDEVSVDDPIRGEIRFEREEGRAGIEEYVYSKSINISLA